MNIQFDPNNNIIKLCMVWKGMVKELANLFELDIYFVKKNIKREVLKLMIN